MKSNDVESISDRMNNDAYSLINSLNNFKNKLGTEGVFNYTNVVSYCKELERQSSFWISQIELGYLNNFNAWAKSVHLPWVRCLPQKTVWHIDAVVSMSAPCLDIWLNDCIDRWLIGSDGHVASPWVFSLGALFAREDLSVSSREKALKLLIRCLNYPVDFDESASMCLSAMIWHGAKSDHFEEALTLCISWIKVNKPSNIHVFLSRLDSGFSDAYQGRGENRGRGVEEVKAFIFEKYGKPKIMENSVALKDLDECALVLARYFNEGQWVEVDDLLSWEARVLSFTANIGQRPRLAQAAFDLCLETWGDSSWHFTKNQINEAAIGLPFFVYSGAIVLGGFNEDTLAIIKWEKPISPLHYTIMLGNKVAAISMIRSGFNFDVQEVLQLCDKLSQHQEKIRIGYKGLEDVNLAIENARQVASWLDLELSIDQKMKTSVKQTL